MRWGVNIFDTADSYGTGSGLDGRSEVLLGTFLRQCPSPNVSGVQIATKFAAYPWRITPVGARTMTLSIHSIARVFHVRRTPSRNFKTANPSIDDLAFSQKVFSKSSPWRCFQSADEEDLVG